MDFGPRPSFGWFDKFSLKIDRAYQREMNTTRSENLIVDIVANFKWRPFGVLYLTEAGHIWDGQHRHAAVMRIQQIAKVPCAVYAATQREAANAFIGVNKNRVITKPINVFKAEVVAGEKEAVAIMKTLAELGITLILDSIPQANQLQLHQSIAISAIRAQYRANPIRARQAWSLAVASKVLLTNKSLHFIYGQLALGTPVPKIIEQVRKL